MNFWIDVTNTCKSALNTGVPRTVRGIYQILCKQGTVTPLRWDRSLHQYCLLTPTEKRALEGDLNAFPSKRWRFLTRHFHKIDLLSKIKSEHYFVQVEIFQDNRIEWIRKNHANFKSISIFHDAIAWSHPELTVPQRSARFDDYMSALSYFTKVITISNESQEALQNYWTSQKLDSPKVIPIIPWPSEFSAVLPSPPPDLVIPEILTISTLEQRKNHLTLFKACESLWEKGVSFKLRVIGKKCPFWGNQVIQEISRLQEKGYAILWEQQISDEALQRAYQQCYFTVYPSVIEGFGLPIVESLSHHRPVICSNRGAIAETARVGGCLTVEVNSSEKIADCLKQLLTDSSLYHRLQTEIDEIQFSNWDQYRTQFMEILSS